MAHLQLLEPFISLDALREKGFEPAHEEAEDEDRSTADYDRRLDQLSRRTRHLVADRFDGDFDVAAYHAARHCNTMHYPQPWAIEIVALIKRI
jgi:hypothetical protein